MWSPGAVLLTAFTLLGAGEVFATPVVNDCQPITNYVTVPGPTVTHFIEAGFTNLEALKEVSSTSSKTGGPYYFTEHSGTTVWLGAAPPTTVSLVKHTSVVTVVPVPSPTITYTSRHTSYNTVTVHPTEPSHEPISSASSSSSEIHTTIQHTQYTTTHATVTRTVSSIVGGGPTSLGWNSTATTPGGYGYGTGSSSIVQISSLSSSIDATVTFVISGTTSLATIPVGPSGEISSDFPGYGYPTGTGSVSTIEEASSTYDATHIPGYDYPTGTTSTSKVQEPSSTFDATDLPGYGYPTTASSVSSVEDPSTIWQTFVPPTGPPVSIPPWATFPSSFPTVSVYQSSQSSADVSVSFIFAPSGFSTAVTSAQETATPTISPVVSASSTEAAPTSTPTSCEGGSGEFGDFIITWDDLPSFTPTNNSTVDIPPVFSPYHHLFYANGYGYIADFYGKYQSASPPDIAVFLPDLSTTQKQAVGGVKVGEIGAGPRQENSAYWFNAYNVSLACDNEGPDTCFVTINSYKYDETEGDESLWVQQFVEIPPCPKEQTKCQLTQITLDEKFRELSGIQFQAVVGQSKKPIFLLDSLAMGWSDNSCAAGQKRMRSRK